MSATALTHDLKTTHSSAAEVNLPGQPFGLSVDHDPAYIFGVPTESDIGPGGAVLGRNRHDYVEERIEIALAEVPGQIVTDLLTVLGHCRNGWTVVYSPLGSSSYGSDEYLVTSTIKDWTQTSYNRWTGRLVMARQGSAY